MDQPPQPIEILSHVVRIDDELVDDGGEPRQGEIKRDGSVRSDHALDRGMRNVALMPQCDVFQGGDDISADHPRQSHHVFR